MQLNYVSQVYSASATIRIPPGNQGMLPSSCSLPVQLLDVFAFDDICTPPPGALEGLEDDVSSRRVFRAMSRRAVRTMTTLPLNRTARPNPTKTAVWPLDPPNIKAFQNDLSMNFVRMMPLSSQLRRTSPESSMFSIRSTTGPLKVSMSEFSQCFQLREV